MAATLISADGALKLRAASIRSPAPVLPLIVFGMFILAILVFVRSRNAQGSMVDCRGILVHGMAFPSPRRRSFYAESDAPERRQNRRRGFAGGVPPHHMPLSLPSWWWPSGSSRRSGTSSCCGHPDYSMPSLIRPGQPRGRAGLASRNLPMAGSVLAALPTVAIYVFLGRYFVRTAGRGDQG